MDKPTTDSETQRSHTDSGTRSSSASPEAGRSFADSGHLRSLVRGLEGGVVATAVMTVFRMPVSRSLPPTANFWAQYVAGGDADDHPVAALVLHVVYGAGGGALFALLAGELDGRCDRVNVRDLALGTLYGFALSLFGTHVVLRRVLGMDLEPDETLLFHVGHVLYGLALGAWVGANR